MTLKFKDKFMPIMDKLARGIPNKFGLREYDIFLRTIVWSGTGPLDRPGKAGATKVVTDYPILVNTMKPGSGNNRPSVRLLSTDEVDASGGLYVNGDFRIGPLTPSYVKNSITYGTLPSDVERQVQDSPQEIFINMKGPGMSDEMDGDWFSLIKTNFTRNFEYTIIVRKTAQKPS